MYVHQLLTSFSYGDAIGNEVLAIRDTLRARGIESSIFALHAHPRYAGLVENHRDYLSRTSGRGILIYHFSIGSPVTRTFLRSQDRRVMIYHNITPHAFFVDYHRVLARDCYKGRLELETLADKVDLALGDSRYNEEELREKGFSPTGVLPLVMHHTRLSRPVPAILRRLFDDGRTNILTVGRLIPNKAVEDVIRAFAVYQKFFNPQSRLFLIGEHRGFERYLGVLQDLVDRLGVRDVHWGGHTPEDELAGYFRLSHLYLHQSEHEGFCAPLPEACAMGLPVLAFNAGAVGETLGGEGLLMNRKDPARTAALMDRVLRDEALRSRILEGQKRVAERLAVNRTGEILLAHLKPWLGEAAPPTSPPTPTEV